MRILKVFLMIIAGILYALGFPSEFSPNFFFLPIIGMVLFLGIIHKCERLSSKLFYLFLFNIGLTYMGFYWIPYTLKEFGEIYPPYNYILSLGFALIVTPQFILYCLFDSFIKNRINKSWYQSLFLHALVLAVLEHITPQQFPAHLGHPWLQLAPHIGLAPFVGAFGYSFFSYLIAGAVVWRLHLKKLPLLPIFVSILFFVSGYFFPLQFSPTEPRSINIRLVQGNVGNLLKIQSENQDKNAYDVVMERFDRLSKLPAARPLDLLIWPETAVPLPLNSPSILTQPSLTPDYFANITSRTGADIFTGGYDKGNINTISTFESEYNAAFLISRNGMLKDVYHKIKLIPFGEGLPFGPFNHFFSKIITNISYFAKGKEFTLFELSTEGRFISAICYEILFSNFIRSYLNSNDKNANFIINLTNDSWYGPTSEPEQHLFLAKWRALEFNLPIIRMTNTGISSVFYPDGSESERTGLFKEQILDLILRFDLRVERTFFQRFGIYPLLFMGIFFMLIEVRFANRET